MSDDGTDGAVPVALEYGDQDVSTDVPIPPQVIEESMEFIERQAVLQFDAIRKMAKDIQDARSIIAPIIHEANSAPFEKFYGVDGGIGSPVITVGGTYSSVIGAAYSPHKLLKPYITIDPISIPAGLGAPHQNYLQMWMKKFETAAALKAAQNAECLFLDGTLVPSIFARFLRSAPDYDLLRPSFIDMFRAVFVNSPTCMLQKLLDAGIPIVGLPKKSHSRHIVQSRLGFMNLPEFVSDLMACSILLEPGEYIDPIDYETVYAGQAENPHRAKSHWELFTSKLRNPQDTPKIAGLDEPVDTIPYIAENTYVTYFKPAPGSVAIRVEILKKDIPNLEKILETLAQDFDKIARLPFCVMMADRYSKSSGHIPQMIKREMATKMIQRVGAGDEQMRWFVNAMFSPLGSQEI